MANIKILTLFGSIRDLNLNTCESILTQKSNMHNEIKLKLRIRNANKAYFAMMFSSRLLSKATKEKLNTSYLRPILMYAYKTWSTTQGDKKKLHTFERKVLRKIYGTVRNQIREYERPNQISVCS